MTTSTAWQLEREAAERYEDILVPAILGPFARALVERSRPRSGETVLDVGCGTGAAARHAAALVGESGRVIAVDINAGVLGVARSLPPPAGAAVDWRQESAHDLSARDGTIDLVVCAQALQFVPDRARALAGIHRVLKPEGRAAFSLWCPLPENVYFDALVGAIARHIGPEVAAGSSASFGLTDPDDLRALLANAAFGQVSIDTLQLELPLPPLREFVPRHITATPMSADFRAASPAQQVRVVEEIVERLAVYESGEGVRLPFRSHLVLATR